MVGGQYSLANTVPLPEVLASTHTTLWRIATAIYFILSHSVYNNTKPSKIKGNAVRNLEIQLLPRTQAAWRSRRGHVADRGM